jgi:hypothetical protein
VFNDGMLDAEIMYLKMGIVTSGESKGMRPVLMGYTTKKKKH